MSGIPQHERDGGSAKPKPKPKSELFGDALARLIVCVAMAFALFTWFCYALMWSIALMDGSAERAFDPNSYLGNHGPWRRHGGHRVISDYLLFSTFGSLFASLLALVCKPRSIVAILAAALTLLSIVGCVLHIPLFD